MREIKNKKKFDQDNEIMYKKERSQVIREQLAISGYHVKKHKEEKKFQLKDEYKEKTEAEKKLIYKYESEAQQLERLEE